MSAKFKCRILRETDAAILIQQEPPNRQATQTWIPRSQCDHISKMPDGKPETGIPATVTCADWIIDKKGLIES
jgi:hypothetical protein